MMPAAMAASTKRRAVLYVNATTDWTISTSALPAATSALMTSRIALTTSLETSLMIRTTAYPSSIAASTIRLTAFRPTWASS